MTTVDQASSITTSRKVLCGVYGAIALAAVILTWVNGGPYIHNAYDFLLTFWRDTKVNSASRFITADCLMLCATVAILVVLEGRKHNVRFVWACVAGTVFVTVSVAVPLFLIARELRMRGPETSHPGRLDTILLAILLCALAGLSLLIDAR